MFLPVSVLQNTSEGSLVVTGMLVHSKYVLKVGAVLCILLLM